MTASLQQPSKPVAALAVGGLLVAGLWLSFYPTLWSGFRLAQVDTLDSRLINHILEHGWLWLRGDPAHSLFWSPPVFWPAANTAAYSETLLGLAPFYWIWRALGVLPDTAYQLWLLSLAILNYGAGLLVLRRGLPIGWLGSSAGAALIAFGSPRLQQLIHAQLLPVFWVLLALFALLRLLDDPARGRRFVIMFFAALVAQLYASFYIGWFLVVGVGLATMIGIAGAAGRSRIREVFVRQWPTLFAAGGGAALVVTPMLLRYLEAAQARGYREFADVRPMLPRLQSWLNMGPDNWLYGGLADWRPFADLPMEHEHRLGVGLLTFGVAVAGLIVHRRDRLVWFVGGPVLAMCALATLVGPEWSAWRLVYDLVPGGAAIRAASRVGLFALIPLGIGFAWAVEGLASRRHRGVAAMIVVACLLEQGAALQSYDKGASRRLVAGLAERVPGDVDAFLYVPDAEIYWRSQVDAMWASVVAGKPTLNGYSGNIPPGWPFHEAIVAAGGAPLDEALRAWAARNDVDPRRVAVITDR